MSPKREKTYRPPDFLGIGAMKSGTSWIWRQLKKHPDISGPRFHGRSIKELHFFDRLRFPLKKYLKKFGALKASRVGEVTPNYACTPFAPLLVKTYFPNVKLFVILRNPVDRAFSHYKDHLCYGRIPEGTAFIDAFRNDHPHDELTHFSIKSKGMYADQLEAWSRHFPPEQFRVMLYEDLKTEPLKFIQGLYEWVGVDPAFVPPRYDRQVLKKYNREMAHLTLSDEDRNEVHEFYKEQVARLQELIKRPLAW